VTAAHARRQAWLTELCTAIDADNDTACEAVVRRFATEGPALGRTERWQAACAWAAARVAEGANPYWAAVQGSIFIAHANN
jgi:hypothetical protein